MGSEILKPYQQGDLDSYCGVYCIVNIAYYLNNAMTEAQAIKLFYNLMKSLHKKHDVVERINLGTSSAEVGGLLEQARETFPFHYQKPY